MRHGNNHSDGERRGGANQDGSPERHREDLSGVLARRAIGGCGSSGKSGEATGSRLPCSAPAIRRLSRRRGESRPLRRPRCPAGTGKSCGMRGGLAGQSPEALCGEAPKSQPVIRGCPRPRKTRPSGKPKERRAETGPPSSLWDRRSRKGLGTAPPNRCMESGMLLGEERRHQGLPREWR